MADQAGARERIDRFWQDPAGTIGAPIGQPGYALPDISGHEWQPIGDESADNWLLAPPGGKARFRGEISGRGNVVVIGRYCTLQVTVQLANHHATVIIGDRTGAGAGNIGVYGNETGGVAFVGAGTTCNGSALFLLGDDARIVIGEDCMFAHDIIIRTNDDHAMIDMETGRQLNPTGNIVLEPHIWVCPNTTILRGARVGLGSVIGTRSVVGGTYPRFTLVAGAPARAARSGISWDRAQTAPADRHLTLQAVDRGIPPAWSFDPPS